MSKRTKRTLPPGPPALDRSTLEKVMRFAESADYDSALALLRDKQRDPYLRNALGVCLMRLGQLEDAVRVYHDLLLKPGCTWMEPERPFAFKVNFAAALLLSGRPSGCVSVLSEINDDENPAVVRLRFEIARWERGLSWWHWLNWRLGGIDPPGRLKGLSYQVGDFGIEPAPADESWPTNPGSPLRTAARERV